MERIAAARKAAEQEHHTAMDDNRIKDILVLGGGTAGWMTASYLGKALGPAVTITAREAPTECCYAQSEVDNVEREGKLLGHN